MPRWVWYVGGEMKVVFCQMSTGDNKIVKMAMRLQAETMEDSVILAYLEERPQLVHFEVGKKRSWIYKEGK